MVRNQRDRLSVVDQIPTEGKLSELLMNTNLRSSRMNHHGRIRLGHHAIHEVELNGDAASLVAFAEEQMQKGMEIDELRPDGTGCSGHRGAARFYVSLTLVRN